MTFNAWLHQHQQNGLCQKDKPKFFIYLPVISILIRNNSYNIYYPSPFNSCTEFCIVSSDPCTCRNLTTTTRDGNEFACSAKQRDGKYNSQNKVFWRFWCNQKRDAEFHVKETLEYLTAKILAKITMFEFKTSLFRLSVLPSQRAR